VHRGGVLHQQLAALPTGAATVCAAVAVLRLGADRSRHACIIARGYDSVPPQRMKRRACAHMLDMWVIFMDISAGQGGLSSVEVEARRGCCRSMLDSVC
jgi:hypothetical protein